MKKIIVLFALISCLLPFNFSKADTCETKCCSDPAGCSDQNAFCKANPPNNIASPTACTNESLPANCSANETKICCCSTSIDQKYIVGQSADTNTQSPLVSLNFTPEISIPGLIPGDAKSTPVGKPITSVSGDLTTVTMKSDLLARYIQAIYNYALAIISILAAIVLMGGGLMWLTSGGDSGRVTKAKEMIIGSLSGLVIIFCAWIILNTVNPELLKLKSIDSVVINKITMTCCEKDGKAEIIIGYQTNSNNVKCELPVLGCCIVRTGGGRILSCSNSMESNCRSNFINLNCTQVISNLKEDLGSNCPDTCSSLGIKDGDRCFNDQYTSAVCYNGICWAGKGFLNEPCGSDTGSVCKLNKDCDRRSSGGRDCEGLSLACCKPQ